VDFDYVTLSSLNRHATAVLKDVGTPKVICVERVLKEIAKWVEVDSRVEVWRKEDGGKYFEGAHWVIGETKRHFVCASDSVSVKMPSTTLRPRSTCSSTVMTIK
jgi:tRNA A37 threonylcarbamoyladenosine dehydratase